MKTLKDLSLADLIALHTNWWLSDGKGARFELLNQERHFEAVERELQDRISDIDFTEGTNFRTPKGQP